MIHVCVSDLPVWELNILKSIREGSESDPLKVLDFRHHNRSVGSENNWLDGTLNSTVLWWKKIHDNNDVF